MLFNLIVGSDRSMFQNAVWFLHLSFIPSFQMRDCYVLSLQIGTHYFCFATYEIHQVFERSFYLTEDTRYQLQRQTT
jgi:hypothetical protein